MGKDASGGQVEAPGNHKANAQWVSECGSYRVRTRATSKTTQRASQMQAHSVLRFDAWERWFGCKLQTH
ncbi:hypothetical protein DSLASN_02000 [Desulfoluna limicola]|uniref:Transposase n=1 Tax=Desulfoluna limicola TaxID=2810562 RepID=A0ABM7PAP9_9BACT|nr:hypothetical protein DSLASN_02000 [Desulfoluna limicola]